MEFEVGARYITEGGEIATYIGKNPYTVDGSTLQHVFARQYGQVFTTNSDGKLGRRDGEPAWCDIVKKYDGKDDY